jgi:hypothetical protein
VDRDVEVRALAKQMKRLDVADNGLCFGRLDSVSGERSYIGRIGLFDEDERIRTAVARLAGAGGARVLRRHRRQPGEHAPASPVPHPRASTWSISPTRSSAVPGGGERGDAALLAAVNAPRGEGMRDIVATIQAEQDEIIRLDHSGVLVIEGGPGTGKTVVALHRVAYLLYTQRKRMERHGVLVVGPNPAFLNHIGRVLPSLGETDVVFMTTGDLVPGLRVTAEDAAGVARLKGSLKILTCSRRRSPIGSGCRSIPIRSKLSDVTMRIDAETAEWAIQEARASGLPHNEARAVFIDIITYVLTERAIARIGEAG